MADAEALEEGDPLGCMWISDEIARVAVCTPVLRFAGFSVPVPREGSSAVGFRVKAQSDDLPDDIEERVTDLAVHVSKPEALSSAT